MYSRASSVNNLVWVISFTVGKRAKFPVSKSVYPFTGLNKLSHFQIIHRDLAARNVLVGEGEKCKVTDFGMARKVQLENVYERKTKVRGHGHPL